MSDAPPPPDPLPAGTAVGRVALRVDAIDRLAPFYRDAIGCRVERSGDRARLAAADGRTLLVLVEDPDARARPKRAAGLFHAAIRLPDRASLANALARVRDAGGSLSGASDHLVSEALYLRDPAGNGLELYRDRPREDWTRRPDGRVEMDTLPLDLADLADAGGASDAGGLPAGTDVGHVHLEVTDLASAAAFYVDGLGLEPSADDYPGARFFAAGGYHHHVAVNTWNRRGASVGDHQGLQWFELRLPGEAAREAVDERLAGLDLERSTVDGATAITDPDGIEVRLVVGD